MVDKEMIRYCAMAMGFKLGTGPDDKVYVQEYQIPGMPLSGQYNPIEDDDEAMELVKTFFLSIDAASPTRNANWFVMDSEGRSTFNHNLNRAIVESVALSYMRKIQAPRHTNGRTPL